MNTHIRLVNSGFDIIDENWGGIYRGGSYLLIGPRKSGRTLLGLQFAKAAADDKEVCLYFTNMRPKDLMIHAASINFDIQKAMNKNNVIVVRVSPPNDAYEMSNPDDYLIDYINDIITVVNQYQPSRLVFDELTHYVGFNSISLLKDVFLHTLETVEEKDISSFFVMGEPATQKAQDIVDSLSEHVTGQISLKKSSARVHDQYNGGTVTITPNVGHPEGRFSDEYFIKPYKGILTREIEDLEDQYTSVDTAEKLPAKAKIMEETPELLSDELGFSNLYEYNDFSLVLNNQVALYKSTGQTFNLVSIMLDPAAQVKGLLSLNQLQNAVRVGADKKDKICIVDNKILVLLIKSHEKSVSNLLSKIQNNLPSADEGYLNAIQTFISILHSEVDESVYNAEGMLSKVISNDTAVMESYKPLIEFVEK